MGEGQGRVLPEESERGRLLHLADRWQREQRQDGHRTVRVPAALGLSRTNVSKYTRPLVYIESFLWEETECREKLEKKWKWFLVEGTVKIIYSNFLLIPSQVNDVSMDILY